MHYLLFILILCITSFNVIAQDTHESNEMEVSLMIEENEISLERSELLFFNENFDTLYQKFIIRDNIILNFYPCFVPDKIFIGIKLKVGNEVYKFKARSLELHLDSTKKHCILNIDEYPISEYNKRYFTEERLKSVSQVNISYIGSDINEGIEILYFVY